MLPISSRIEFCSPQPNDCDRRISLSPDPVAIAAHRDAVTEGSTQGRESIRMSRTYHPDSTMNFAMRAALLSPRAPYQYASAGARWDHRVKRPAPRATCGVLETRRTFSVPHHTSTTDVKRTRHCGQQRHLGLARNENSLRRHTASNRVTNPLAKREQLAHTDTTHAPHRPPRPTAI